MTNEEILKKNGGEKFSIALGNPPYAKGLHLQFLEKTIQVADKTIFIQPCGFLETPNSNNYKEYKESIVNKISDIDVIAMEDGRELFGIDINEDLMICLCKQDNKEPINILSKECLSIIDKVMPYVKEHKFIDLEEKDKIDGHRVKTGQYKSIVFGGRGNDSLSRRDACSYVDDRGPYLDGYNEGEQEKYKGKWFKDCYAKGGPSNSKQYDGFASSIKFDTREEALNFMKSCSSNFCKNWNWILMTKKLAIVPPTFDKVWTDKDFCEYFKLNEEESKLMSTYIYDYRKAKPFIKYTKIK